MDARYYDNMRFESIPYSFYGTEAPKLERPEEKTREKRAPKTHERVRIRTKTGAAAKSKQGISLLAMFGWACAAVLAVTLLMSYVKLDTIADDTYQLNQQLDEMKLEETKLKIEYESTFKVEDVESYATNMLGMVKADKDQIKYLNNESEDQAVIVSDGKKDSGFKAKLKSLLTSVAEYFD